MYEIDDDPTEWAARKARSFEMCIFDFRVGAMYLFHVYEQPNW